ncbi:MULTISPECIES: class I SAM-dependent methyltransferase [Eikenella]|uniref:SAM-dependent methyltransferase n=1 Tax=Eikenella longinqua TaxID=1795827 RepID=A0A1A9S3C0_9NEIS|nr:MULTISPECIES: class I SAM-dependent methyltransferase [Eikenella]OAM31278.1 SAM-dependent methyltransferase [Eikenella longinqua]
MSKDQTGHHFLARLGKTRLRPGGRRATDWLISQARFTPDSRVLEVACNMGTTTVGLAQRFGCHITGVDLDENALAKARQNIAAAGLEQLVQVQHANATALPFPDNSFDIVINEAMLTMLPLANKQMAVAEYFRVLKPGGVLLTHDVVVSTHDTEAAVQRLRDTIQVKVTPLTESAWTELFRQGGFADITTLSGGMTLLSPAGLLHDEGWRRTLHILKNALKAENRATFKCMYCTFNDPAQSLGFIAVCSRKPA